MGKSGRFEGEIDLPLPGGSFSRLLLSPDDNNAHEQFSFFMHPSPPLFSPNTPKLLCFGDFASQTSLLHSTDPPKPDSSSSHKRRARPGQQPGKRAANQTERNGKKKKKAEMVLGPTPSATRTTSAAHAKARREKLGERIATLQQLVSPYGKTDTASVLHEAMGYIRFLHDQVKALSSPYLQRLPSTLPPHLLSEKGGRKLTEATKGLQSRGLCLVPVQYLVDVVNSNGADFWSPAASVSPLKP